MLHEFTHLEAIYFPPTIYLHKKVVALDTANALRHADSYAYYAKAVGLASATCADPI